MRVRRGVIGALAAVAVLAAPAAAQGALQWSDNPQIVSEGGRNGSQPRAASDANGNAVLAWVENDGSKRRVRVAFRSAGDFFANQTTVSDLARDARDPILKMAPDGSAVLVWVQDQPPASGQPANTDRTDVVASYRPAGGAFGAPEILSADSTTSSGSPGAGIDSNGMPIVTWVRNNTDPGDNATISTLVARRRPAGAGGSWGPIVGLFQDSSSPLDNGAISAATIEFDPVTGGALIGFADARSTTFADQGYREARVLEYIPAGAYESPQLVGTRGGASTISAPDVAIRNDIQVATWTRVNSGPEGAAEYAVRPGGLGAWTTHPMTGDLSTAHLADFAEVGFDSSGNVLAVLDTKDGALHGTSTAFMPAGATTFNPPIAVTGANPPSFTAYRMTAAGAVRATWLENGHLMTAERPPGEVASFDAPVDLATPDGGTRVDVAPDGRAIASWTVSDGLNQRVNVKFGELPPPPPPPDQPPGETPPPPPVLVNPPPPPPEAPVPSAIQPVGKITADRPIVLTVAVSGRVNRIEWTINKSQPLSGGAQENAVRFRANGDFNVTVKAFGPGGTKTFSRALSAPKAPKDDTFKKVRQDKKVFATGTPGALLGTGTGCGQITVYAGDQSLAGCFRPIDEIEDIPSSERGVLDVIARAIDGRVTDSALMRRAVELSDGYVANPTITINGLWPLTAVGGARLVSYPGYASIVSANASFRVAGQPFGPAGKGLNMKLDPDVDDIDLGSQKIPSKLSSLGGFKFTGDFKITLGKSSARIATALKLPSFVTRNGAVVQQPIELQASADSLTFPSGPPQIGPLSTRMGQMPVPATTLRYDAASGDWVGSGRACVAGFACLEFAPPNGELRFHNGELTRAFMNFDFGDPGKPLTPVVFLKSAGLGFGLNPSRLFGTAKLGIGPFLTVDGHEVLAAPSAAAPYRMSRDEVGNSFPPELYNTPFTRPLVAVGGDVKVTLPFVGDTVLGGGYLLYEVPGFVSLGGGSSINVLGIIRFSGGIAGQMDVVKQLYNLHGDISACLIAVDDDLCAKSVTNVSRGPNLEGGAGGCMQIGPVSVGGGVQWARPHDPFVWPVDGCKWSKFKIDIRPSKVRAAQAGGPDYPIVVKKDDPSQAIKVAGAGGAPLVHVEGPTGSLDATDKPIDFTADGKLRILRVRNNVDAPYTVVGLQDPTPGTYIIRALPGSVPITGVSVASDPPAARASGSVSGPASSAKRTLAYDVVDRPDQRVTFYDVGRGGSMKVIKTITGGGKGTISWSPAPGRAVRKVVAHFELNGMAAEEKPVTSFRPPSPTLPRPRALRVRRSGTKVTISWGGVPGATAYEVALTTSDGKQVFKTVKSRSLVLGRIAKTLSGRVTVSASAELREGATASGSFKRLARERSGFSSLKHCSVKKKRVRCSR